MAYSSWPDHGVPESSEVNKQLIICKQIPNLFFEDFNFTIFFFSKLQEFVDFVENVRSRRKGSMEPTIVHCSAGIGMFIFAKKNIFTIFFKTNLLIFIF